MTTFLGISPSHSFYSLLYRAKSKLMYHRFCGVFRRVMVPTAPSKLCFGLVVGISQSMNCRCLGIVLPSLQSPLEIDQRRLPAN